MMMTKVPGARVVKTRLRVEAAATGRTWEGEAARTLVRTARGRRIIHRDFSLAEIEVGVGLPPMEEPGCC
jgi:hypothetical protein